VNDVAGVAHVVVQHACSEQVDRDAVRTLRAGTLVSAFLRERPTEAAGYLPPAAAMGQRAPVIAVVALLLTLSILGDAAQLPWSRRCWNSSRRPSMGGVARVLDLLPARGPAIHVVASMRPLRQDPSRSRSHMRSKSAVPSGRGGRSRRTATACRTRRWFRPAPNQGGSYQCR
jgi:hypothetical protein